MATSEVVHAHAAPQGFIRKYIFSLDHKIIGMQYFFLALTAVWVGMILSLLMRIHLIWPTPTCLCSAIFSRKLTWRCSLCTAPSWCFSC